MNETTSKALALSSLTALVLVSAPFASAQDVSVTAETSVTVEATTTRPKPRPIVPQRIQELRENAQERIMNLREGLKAETRIELQNASSAEDRRSIIKEAQEERIEMRDRAVEIRGDLKQRMQALVQTHVGAILRRSENAINLFVNLTERIEMRIDKLKAAGANTASVEASLEASARLVAEAQADRDALASLVASVDASANVADVKARIRAAVQELTASVKAAHAALLKTARELVQVSASVSVEAEASASN